MSIDFNMNNWVKEFVEQNIKLIENNEWNKVFAVWHYDAADLWMDDEEEFRQFINILGLADIEPNMDVRKDVLKSIIKGKMEYILQHQEAQEYKNFIGVFGVINDLNSLLGYSTEEVQQFIDEVAKQLNLTPTDFYGKGYTWKD